VTCLHAQPVNFALEPTASGLSDPRGQVGQTLASDHAYGDGRSIWRLRIWRQQIKRCDLELAGGGLIRLCERAVNRLVEDEQGVGVRRASTLAVALRGVSGGS